LASSVLSITEGLPSFVVEDESWGFEIQSSPLIGADVVVSFGSGATDGADEAGAGS
jgi:hypothetical protein